MRQKFARRLSKVSVKIDDIMVRLEEIQHDMSDEEECDEITTALDSLQEAIYAINDMLPQAA
ncbi:MAG: hypothetical protein AB7I79_03205 [Rhizobiaceae bacterium]